MEEKNYVVLYKKREGSFCYFKQYVLKNIFPFFILIFIVLNSILLIANQQWTDSNTFHKFFFLILISPLDFSKNTSSLESAYFKELFRLSSERVHTQLHQVFFFQNFFMWLFQKYEKILTFMTQHSKYVCKKQKIINKNNIYLQ